MVDVLLFEQRRKELETVLNREISATKEVRDYEIKLWIEGAIEQIRPFFTDEEFGDLDNVEFVK